MPELAEVEWFRKQWNPGLKQRIDAVLVHDRKRIFRGGDLPALKKALTGATLERSEARGKQMLFVARPARSRERAWLGLHLGMTGHLRVEKPGFTPGKHDHLVLRQKEQSLVFKDARLFGRVLFGQGKKAPIKAVLLMQERFPGIGNWMADEILWRAGIHPAQPAGSLTAQETAALYRDIRGVCRDALRIIGKNWDDPPDSWLFNHRWEKGGTCPRTGAKLKHATIGGRTTCWSPARQKLRA
jgi:formamidopyrimidine-DNA glycosylase